MVYYRDQQLEVEVLGENEEASLCRTSQDHSAVSTSVWRLMKQWPMHHGQASGLSARECRLPLNASQNSRDMLNVHVPVNIGIPSVLDMKAVWFDPLELYLPLPSDRHCCRADRD